MTWLCEACPYANSGPICTKCGWVPPFVEENNRLTAMLHRHQVHEDWEYAIRHASNDKGREALMKQGWERNPEAETPGGDECWRRRK